MANKAQLEDNLEQQLFCSLEIYKTIPHTEEIGKATVTNQSKRPKARINLQEEVNHSVSGKQLRHTKTELLPPTKLNNSTR